MIPKKVNQLFEFIDFLHSNIDNFNKFNPVIENLKKLDIERNKLKPLNHYKDKLDYEKIQIDLKEQYKIIDDAIIQKIKRKSIELDISDWENEISYFNKCYDDVWKLKHKFQKEDVPLIMLHKNKFIEFRTKTKNDYFQSFFFKDLDKIMKVLFDYFKDTSINEFKEFETKTIKVNNYKEVIKTLQQNKGKNIKISFKNPLLTKSSNENNTTTINTTTPTINKIDFANDLFDRLKAKGCIEINTSKLQYNKLFNGSKIDANFIKINWINTIGSFKLFIQNLPKEYYKKEIIENIFLHKGKILTIKQVQNNKPSKKDNEKIDALFKDLSIN